MGLRKEYDPVYDTDREAMKRMACAIILDAAKDYASPYHCASCREFFLGPDYRFWARYAGIDVDGETILNALIKNGGLPKGAMIDYVTSNKEVKAG